MRSSTPARATGARLPLVVTTTLSFAVAVPSLTVSVAVYDPARSGTNAGSGDVGSLSAALLPDGRFSVHA